MFPRFASASRSIWVVGVGVARRLPRVVVLDQPGIPEIVRAEAAARLDADARVGRHADLERAGVHLQAAGQRDVGERHRRRAGVGLDVDGFERSGVAEFRDDGPEVHLDVDVGELGRAELDRRVPGVELHPDAERRRPPGA